MKKISLLVLIILMLANSCLHNKIRYIQEKNENLSKTTEYENIAPAYLLQKKDILYIRISSNNKEIEQLFNPANTQTSNFGNIGINPFYLNGFTVNDSGLVHLPVVGAFLVEGKTIKETEQLISERIGERINNARIQISLVSFYLTFIGEFNSQGKITVMQDKINILDAIALAGGISDFGNKKNILIVRQTVNGTKTFRLDVTDRQLLKSENFFLAPNDILIAEPMKNKSFQLGIRDYSTLLTTLTSTITMVLLVINLLK